MSEERLHGEKLRELRSTSGQKPDPGTRDAEAGSILPPALGSQMRCFHYRPSEILAFAHLPII